LKVLGFERKATRGSHAQYENATRNKVTVDLAINEFTDFLLKSMISQSGATRELFYGATKVTAKKIDKR
jgi:predicted RNA binding protein YcfA (HicA-like mRNA interferase family)